MKRAVWRGGRLRLFSNGRVCRYFGVTQYSDKSIEKRFGSTLDDVVRLSSHHGLHWRHAGRGMGSLSVQSQQDVQVISPTARLVDQLRIRPSNVLLKHSVVPWDCGCLMAPVFTRTPKYLKTDSTSAFRNSDTLSMRTTFGGPQRLHSAVNALAAGEASCRANVIFSAHLVNESTAASTQW